MKKVFISLCLLFAGGVSFAQNTEEPALVLSLENALEIALTQSPSVKVADQTLQITRYDYKGSIASLFPNISASGSYTRNIKLQYISLGGDSFPMGSPNTFQGGVNLSMPVLNAVLWGQISISKLDVELAIEKSRASRIDMVEQVTKCYYQILLAKESLKVYRQIYENAVKTAKETTDKFNAGSVSEFDKLTADVRVQNAIPDVNEMENSVKLALWQLKALLGMDLQKNIDVSGSLEDYKSALDEVYSYSNLNLENNTTLRSFDMQERQLEKAVRLAKYANIPTLSFNASYLYSAMGSNERFVKREAWNPYAFVGLSLNIPIFSGFKNRYAAKQARIAYSRIQTQREDTERQLRVSLASHLSTMETSAKSYSAAASSIEQAQRGYDIALKRYDVGRGTQLEIDQSQLALVQAQLAANSAIFNFITSKISIDQLMGKFESANIGNK